MFGRIIVIIFALLLAIVAAGITLAVGIVAPDWAGADADPVERLSFFVVSFFATSFVGMVAFLPAILAVVIGEAARLRNFLYYGVGGAVVGLASYYGTNISVQLENTTDVAPVTNALQLAAAAGIMGNDEGLIGRLRSAGQLSGEKYWQLPLYDEYKEVNGLRGAHKVEGPRDGKPHAEMELTGVTFSEKLPDATFAKP